jgi:hypothetical protein
VWEDGFLAGVDAPDVTEKHVFNADISLLMIKCGVLSLADFVVLVPCGCQLQPNRFHSAWFCSHSQVALTLPKLSSSKIKF